MGQTRYITPGFTQAGDQGAKQGLKEKHMGQGPRQGPGQEAEQMGQAASLHDVRRSVASNLREGVVPPTPESPQPRLAHQLGEKWRSKRGTSSCCWQGCALGLQEGWVGIHQHHAAAW